VEPSISGSPILLTANFVWNPSASHFEEHRFIVSAYVIAADPSENESFFYYLADRYMTFDKYEVTIDDDGSHKTGLFVAEKPEILARLKRVKAEEERRKQAPH